MRVTRKQLKAIIHEALNNVEKLEDVETVEDAWGSGEDLEQDLDYAKIMTGESSIDEPEMLDMIVKEVRRRISEEKDQNDDGENDFDDVKIARMKASGMSAEEIEKEHPDLFKEDIGELVSKVLDKITSNEEEGRELGYGEGEGRMTKSQLDKLAKYSQSLHDKLRDEDDLPEWVQAKITSASDGISKVYHYLEYKIDRMED